MLGTRNAAIYQNQLAIHTLRTLKRGATATSKTSAWQASANGLEKPGRTVPRLCGVYRSRFLDLKRMPKIGCYWLSEVETMDASGRVRT